MDNVFDDFFNTVFNNQWVILGAFAVALLSYYFGQRNNRINRRAAACQRFRSEIQAAIATIPAADKHWGPDITSKFPAICDQIGSAVAEFKYSVPWIWRRRFCRAWQNLKDHCENEIPIALSAAEVLYGAGPPGAKSAKDAFYTHVEKLLSYAKQT